MLKARKTALAVMVAAGLATLPMSFAVYAAEKGNQGHDSSMKGGMSGPSMEMHHSMMKGMKEMDGMKPSGNVDRDFATMMRLHHAQALQMAQVELQHGKDQKMRDMAQKIIDGQKKEIAEFDEWLKANPAPKSAGKDKKGNS
jgi:uncharacterized protein (DUF305 family)